MAQMYPTSLEDKRVWIRALLLACPFKEPLESCPLQDLRELPVEDITRISETMDEEKLHQVISYHQDCLSKRINRQRNKSL